MRSVEDICREVIQDDLAVSTSSSFIQAVARHLGLERSLSGNANIIRGRFSDRVVTHYPFRLIGRDPHAATAFAQRGELVIGGLIAEEMADLPPGGHEHKATMGHVVIVVPGGPSKREAVTLADGTMKQAPGGYPYCYQGTSYRGYRLRERTQVDVVFPKSRMDRVIYAWLERPPGFEIDAAPAETPEEAGPPSIADPPSLPAAD